MNTHILFSAIALFAATNAQAFCGFFVAKAEATLFNDKSEVILVRDGERTTITMGSDFKGSVKDFALVVPVPVVLERDDIRVVDAAIFRMLDSYSAPRLVEYYDEDPCQPRYLFESVTDGDAPASATNVKRETLEKKSKAYGVTIEAQYTVGEYDILILSATQSTGLKDWLRDNGYKIPASAHEVLDPYIKSNLKFFVVKVDLKELASSGSKELRPLQIRFEHPKFMLPIRLGMANSSGDQDMIVYAFTRTGRVECVNYRTVKVPTDRNIPLFINERFGDFYRDLFARAWRREGRNAVFLEYAWNVTPGWGGMKCDPCVGPPPLDREFVQAGVDWTGRGSQGAQVFFTRMHVRYGRDKFPADLAFQVTPNTEQFQARYVLTHPAQGDLSCSEGRNYLENLYYRRGRELDELAMLTGWDASIYRSYSDEIRLRLPPERRNALDTPSFPFSGPSGGGPGLGALLLLIAGCALAAFHFARPVLGKMPV